MRPSSFGQCGDIGAYEQREKRKGKNENENTDEQKLPRVVFGFVFVSLLVVVRFFSVLRVSGALHIDRGYSVRLEISQCAGPLLSCGFLVSVSTYTAPSATPRPVFFFFHFHVCMHSLRPAPVPVPVRFTAPLRLSFCPAPSS